MNGKTRKSGIDLSNTVSLALAFVSTLINRNLYLFSEGSPSSSGLLEMGSGWWGYRSVIRKIVPTRTKMAPAAARSCGAGLYQERQVIFLLESRRGRGVITVQLAQNWDQECGTHPWDVSGFEMQEPGENGQPRDENVIVRLWESPFYRHQQYKWFNRPYRGGDSESV